MCGSCFVQAPVVSSDACSTCSCGFLILFVVMSVDMGLFGLLLEDLSELIFADAAEERSHVVRFLDHPLKNNRHKSSDEHKPQTQLNICTKFKGFTCVTDLSNLYRVLRGSSSVILNFELLYKFVKPAHRDKDVIFHTQNLTYYMLSCVFCSLSYNYFNMI